MALSTHRSACSHLLYPFPMYTLRWQVLSRAAHHDGADRLPGLRRASSSWLAHWLTTAVVITVKYRTACHTTGHSGPRRQLAEHESGILIFVTLFLTSMHNQKTAASFLLMPEIFMKQIRRVYLHPCMDLIKKRCRYWFLSLFLVQHLGGGGNMHVREGPPTVWVMTSFARHWHFESQVSVQHISLHAGSRVTSLLHNGGGSFVRMKLERTEARKTHPSCTGVAVVKGCITVLKRLI